jgi:sugar O-acyltransferase (sialic acid O-acetyltransferase NeuD family)
VTRRLFGLYGAGGFGRGVMPIVRQQLASQGWRVVFLETRPSLATVNGVELWSEDRFFEESCDERGFAVAIADSRARERIALRCEARGARAVTLQAANATVYDMNEVGAGAILCAQAVVTSNVRIGRHFHANLLSYVEHDCVIGDWVTFAPRVSCNGNVQIGDHAYIGTGAMIHPGVPGGPPLRIGEGAIVGMGAVVLRDVAPHTTVVGNPARVLPRR